MRPGALINDHRRNGLFFSSPLSLPDWFSRPSLRFKICIIERRLFALRKKTSPRLLLLLLSLLRRPAGKASFPREKCNFSVAHEQQRYRGNNDEKSLDTQQPPRSIFQASSSSNVVMAEQRENRIKRSEIESKLDCLFTKDTPETS